jgi:hypothetical protein
MNNLFTSDNLSSQLIHEILERARSRDREELVARALVCAHLELHYASSIALPSESDHHGEVLVNDTLFHVTVAPTPYLYQRCQANLQNGYQVFILVPERILPDVRQYVATILPGKVTVASIEVFLTQSIEYSAAFSIGEIMRGFRQLLEMYNQRIAAQTRDTSLLIELPPNQTIQ